MTSPNSVATSTQQRRFGNALSLGLIATAMFTACSAVTAQSYQSRNERQTLSSGTVIPVTLNTELSSDGSSRGDGFTAAVDNSKQAYDGIMRGATVSGVVRKATAQTGNDPGMLEVAFTSLRLSDGRSYPISGSLTSMDPKRLNIDDSGILRAKNTSKNNRLTYAGIGAGAGAIVGLLGGGKLKIEDILLGGLAGYGVGSILKSPEQVHNVDLQAGTPMGVLLSDQLSFAPQSSDSPSRNYHRTYTHGGIKYYWFNGQRMGLNLATGQRFNTSDGGQSSGSGSGKYYTYQGHPYHLNFNTGVRTQLD